MRELELEISLPVPPEVLEAKEEEAVKWLEIANAEELELREKVDNIKKAMLDDKDNSSIHLRGLID